MLVYRICDKEEVNSIIHNQSCEAAGFEYLNKLKSTHNYEEGKLYMHFFDRLSNILYLDPVKGRYICTYNIPEEVLKDYQGKRTYVDIIRHINMCSVPEYAIPSENVNFEYLQKIDEIKTNIEYEDFWINPTLEGQVETHYRRIAPKLLLKEKGRN